MLDIAVKSKDIHVSNTLFVCTCIICRKKIIRKFFMVNGRQWLVTALLFFVAFVVFYNHDVRDRDHEDRDQQVKCQ